MYEEEDERPPPAPPESAEAAPSGIDLDAAALRSTMAATVEPGGAEDVGDAAIGTLQRWQAFREAWRAGGADAAAVCAGLEAEVVGWAEGRLHGEVGAFHLALHESGDLLAADAALRRARRLLAAAAEAELGELPPFGEMLDALEGQPASAPAPPRLSAVDG